MGEGVQTRSEVGLKSLISFSRQWVWIILDSYENLWHDTIHVLEYVWAPTWEISGWNFRAAVVASLLGQRSDSVTWEQWHCGGELRGLWASLYVTNITKRKLSLSLMPSQRCETCFAGVDLLLFTFSKIACSFRTNDMYLAC